METPVLAIQNIEKNERDSSFIFWLLGLAGLIGFEQSLKFILFKFLSFEKSYLIWEEAGGFGLKLFRNTEFAFSTPVPEPLMYLIYFVSLSALAWWAWKNWKKVNNLSRLTFILITAGGLSNLGERVISGGVRDYLLIANGIFNLADLYILVGVVWFLQREFRSKSL